jgi:hypothetical protein
MLVVLKRIPKYRLHGLLTSGDGIAFRMTLPYTMYCTYVAEKMWPFQSYYVLYFIKLPNVDLTKLLTHLRDNFTAMSLIKPTKLPQVTFRKLPDVMSSIYTYAIKIYIQFTHIS